MKRILLCIVLMALTSCAQRDVSSPAQSSSPYRQASIDVFETKKSLYEAIEQEIHTGTALTRTWKEPGLLPPYIFEDQLDWKDENNPLEAEIWKIGKVELLPIYQVGMNGPVAFGGDYGYAGVLTRIQGTELWYDFFRVPIEYKAYKTESGREQLFLTDKNIIGAFTKDAKFFIDVADNNGAGSGEGTMTRFIFDENGWSYGGCFYFKSNFTEQPGSTGLHYDPFGQEILPRAECLL